MEVNHRYPFIDKFVHAMTAIDAHEYVTNDLDLASLVTFFKLYIDTCRSLDKDQQTPEMIAQMMKFKFHLRYHDKNKITSYINTSTNEIHRQITENDSDNK